MANVRIKLDLVEKAPELVIEYGDVTSFTFSNLEDWKASGVEEYFILGSRIEKKRSLMKTGKLKTSDYIEIMSLSKVLGTYALQNPEDKIKWLALSSKEQSMLSEAYMNWNAEESKKKEEAAKKTVKK